MGNVIDINRAKKLKENTVVQLDVWLEDLEELTYDPSS